MNLWRNTFTPVCTFIAWYIILQTDIFAFYLYPFLKFLRSSTGQEICTYLESYITARWPLRISWTARSSVNKAFQLHCIRCLIKHDILQFPYLPLSSRKWTRWSLLRWTTQIEITYFDLKKEIWIFSESPSFDYCILIYRAFHNVLRGYKHL